MSKDNEKELKEKKNLETKEKKEIEKKETVKEESKKETTKKVKKAKKEEKKGKKQKKVSKNVAEQEDGEVIIKDSQIREKAMILGSYLLEKLKEYRFVILLEIIVYLLLFFLIPQVIFDVKPFVWMIAFALFAVLPTIGIYGMNKFKDKQILFSFVVMYLLILVFLKRFAIIDLYGITSHGNLDHTPAWLDAVFVTCIIVFFQYIGILIVNVYRKFKRSNKKKSIKK